MLGFLLLAISIILSWIIYPIGIVYTFIKLTLLFNFKAIYRNIDNLCLSIAFSIDKLGNVAMQYIFNDLLITRNGHKFGSAIHTISFVLGANQKRETLRPLGQMLVNILNSLDENHCLKAYNNGI